MDDKLIPDPDTVSPSYIPTIPAPVPILMPSPGDNSKSMPKPETTKDNLQYK